MIIRQKRHSRTPALNIVEGFLARIHHTLDLAAVCRFCKLLDRTHFLFDRHSRMFLAGIHNTTNLAAVCRFCKLLNRTCFLFDRHSRMFLAGIHRDIAGKTGSQNPSTPWDDRQKPY